MPIFNMLDMFRSSPASTATRRSHHETYNSSTARLILVLSTPCRSSSSDVAPTPKPAAASRHEYKQLIMQRQISRRTKSSSSCCGADSAVMEMICNGEQLRRSYADASDTKVLRAGTNRLDCLLNKLLESGTRSRSSSISYDDNQQEKQEVQQHGIGNIKVVDNESSRYTTTTTSSSSCSSRRPPLTVASSSSPAAGYAENNDDCPKLKRSSSTWYHGSTDKVVVLWVSLHCKGCGAKVRKHISKMEGVKSFSTDCMPKRVTIIGNLDPHGVHASVSTVKYAHFWPSSSSPPSPSSSSSSSALLPLATSIIYVIILCVIHDKY